MAEEKPKRRDRLIPDEARHRKKHPQTSKSRKRADHKHQYEKVILQTIVGWDWGQCCTICGRISNQFAFASEDFMRPDRKQRPGVSSADFYSLEEVLSKFPSIPVYLYDSNFEMKKYEDGVD